MAVGAMGLPRRGGMGGSGFLGGVQVAPAVVGLVPLQRVSGQYLQNVSRSYLYRRDYSAAALTLFAAMGTQPTQYRKMLYNNFILALQASGAWALMDCIYLLAAANSQAALLNIKSPSTFTATPINAPTFTADRDYTGNATSQVLDSGFKPATAGGNMALNSAHVGLWCRTDNATGTGAAVGNLNTTLQNKSSALDTAVSRLNAGSTITTNGLPTGSLNHWVANRNNAANYDIWGGGSKAASAIASATTAMSSLSFTMLGRQTAAATYQYNGYPMSAFHWGGALSDAQVLSVYNALYAFLHGVEAA